MMRGLPYYWTEMCGQVRSVGLVPLVGAAAAAAAATALLATLVARCNVRTLSVPAALDRRAMCSYMFLCRARVLLP